jgi:hypothetical protein
MDSTYAMMTNIMIVGDEEEAYFSSIATWYT